MADLFREIDEELRRDKALRFWREHGKYVLAAALAVVVAVGLAMGWRDWRQRERLADGARFAEAQGLVLAEKPAEAAAAFAQLASGAGGGYAMLARFEAAALKLRAGDAAGGLALYQGLANDSGLAKAYRDLALLLSVMHGVDEGEPAALIQRLVPLTAADNPWRFTALELNALLEQRAGNAEPAREIYKRLAEDALTPVPLRSRAGEMLAVLDPASKPR